MSQRIYMQFQPLITTMQLRIPLHYASSPGVFKALSTGRAVPRIAEKSMWTAMIPRFLRSGWRKSQPDQAVKKKERNPAIFFLVMFTLIGSQSIRMVSLRNEYENYVRSTDAKIRLLNEIIERLKRGEEVDVKKVLGTGDEASEREWEEVLEEIEMEDMKWSKAKEKPSTPKNDQPTQPSSGNDETPNTKSTPTRSRFY